MGVVLPGVSSPEDLWALLRGDRTVFSEPGGRVDLETFWSPDPTTPDRTYTRISGFMPPAPPAGGPVEDFTVTWLRHCIAQATEKVLTRETDRHLFAVGLTPDGSHHLEQSLVVRELRRLLGEVDGETRRLLHELYPLAADDPEHMLPFRIARRAAADLPEGTEIVVLDTACSSSLYGIDIGMRALRAGEADIAICGGAFALSVQNLVLFARLSGLSRSGAVRPLDHAADGVLFTDGAGVLALKDGAYGPGPTAMTCWGTVRRFRWLVRRSGQGHLRTQPSGPADRAAPGMVGGGRQARGHRLDQRARDRHPRRGPGGAVRAQRPRGPGQEDGRSRPTSRSSATPRGRREPCRPSMRCWRCATA